MKRRIVLCFFFVACISVFAQEMAVETFEAKPAYELTDTEVQRDGNGEVCALINVYFSEQNTSFEGTYVVGDSKIGHSYQVFLAGGASKMTVKHDNYLPLTIRFSDYQIKKLEGGRAYELHLVADKSKYLSSECIDDDKAELVFRRGLSFMQVMDGDPDYSQAVSCFREAAELGHVKAMYHLGQCYYYGWGVDQSYDFAIQYFREASEKGHAMAQFRYAICLDAGYGSQGRKVEEAIKWYERSACQGVTGSKNNVACIYLFNDPTGYLIGTSDKKELGYPGFYSKGVQYLKDCEKEGISEALMNLGRIYEDGIIVRQDFSKAVAYYNKAIANGVYEAYANLGNCYYNGLGVKQDVKKAFELYQLAAQKGVANGMYSIALSYQFGLGVKQNINQAVLWYQKAAEQKLAIAETNLGSLYMKGTGVKKDLEKAYELFIRSAKHGDPNGYTNIGYMHLEGIYVKQDIRKAIDFFEKAAQMGNYTALINLATMYQTGTGVAVNAQKAISYYERAGKMDPTGAAFYNLGTLYYLGCGSVRQDLQKAFELFLETAEKKNYAPAQYNLGVMYINGQYVKRNPQKGKKYIKLAAKQHYQLAIDFLRDNP